MRNECVESGYKGRRSSQEGFKDNGCMCRRCPMSTSLQKDGNGDNGDDGVDGWGITRGPRGSRKGWTSEIVTLMGDDYPRRSPKLSWLRLPRYTASGHKCERLQKGFFYEPEEGCTRRRFGAHQFSPNGWRSRREHNPTAAMFQRLRTMRSRDWGARCRQSSSPRPCLKTAANRSNRERIVLKR